MNTFHPVWRCRTVRRTTGIALFCAAFLVGIALAPAGWHIGGAWALIAVLLLVPAYKRPAIPFIAVVIVAGLVAGVWRGSQVYDSTRTFEESTGKKVTLRGTVVDDAAYSDKGQRDMRLQNVSFDGRSPPGAVRVTSFTLVQPRRGDVVEVKGKLYKGFGNYQAAIYFGELTILSVASDPLDMLRRSFAAGVYSNMPDAPATLGLGLLTGMKAQLPDEFDNQLKLLTLTHIVVASGYNLTVLVRVARRLFERRSKFQTAAVGAMLMGIFVLVTGVSASMSRAALVGGLCLAAWYYGRRIHPVVLLLFAAALTAAVYPFYLWYDLGWWLSFLAFAGVMLAAPLIQSALYKQKRPKLVGQVVIETIAAQLATMPLILMVFGKLSVLGLVANVLIVPLVPLAMLVTLIAGIGASLGAAAPFIALPAVWLLTYMMQLIGLLAAIPWAAATVQISVASMIGLYAAMLVVGIVLWRKTGHDFYGRSVIE